MSCWRVDMTAIPPNDAPARAGRGSFTLLARERGGRPAGFVLAADHRDGPLWQRRAWVEVEALYVEPAWQGAVDARTTSGMGMSPDGGAAPRSAIATSMSTARCPSASAGASSAVSCGERTSAIVKPP